MTSEVEARINKYRVLIVDDHPIVRRGLTGMIKMANRLLYAVVGGLSNSNELNRRAVQWVLENR